MHHRHFPRIFTYCRDEFPAFHAGFLVVLAIAVSLCPLGVFALLLAASLTIDGVAFQHGRGSALRGMLRALRSWMTDLALFVIGALLLVSVSALPILLPHGGALLAFWTALLAGLLLIPKLVIAHRFLHRMRRLFTGERPSPENAPLSLVEALSLFALFLGLFLLPFSVKLIPGGMSFVVKVLRRQMVPWRL